MKQSLSASKEERLYLDEIKRLKPENPTITEKFSADEAIVWCLSGRTTVMGHNPDKLGDKRPVDPTDDIERFLLSIKISKERGGIPILYNGTDEENVDLRAFLKICSETDSIEGLSEALPELYDYLSKHYNDEQILDIIAAFKEASDFIKIVGDGITDTISQKKSLSDILAANKNIKSVDCVSSTFHLPRVARTISKSANPDVNYVLHGIDLKCERPGTDLDLKSEPDAIKNYTAKGWIAAKISENVYLSRSPAVFRSCSALFPIGSPPVAGRS